MDATLEEPMRLKAELAKTREVIAKKFTQSQNDRIKRERAIDETFGPTIKNISKLINQNCDDEGQNCVPIDDPGAEIDNEKNNLPEEEVNGESENESQVAGKKRQRPNKKAYKRVVPEKDNRIIFGSGDMKGKRRKTAQRKTEEKAFIPYNPNIVYEYYDDPNELCDRLRLLTSSQRAGNTNHDQEINSILEELYEQGIIL